jgi:hypothetical protein
VVCHTMALQEAVCAGEGEVSTRTLLFWDNLYQGDVLPRQARVRDRSLGEP